MIHQRSQTVVTDENDSGYSCSHCGRPIPMRSFRPIGPFHPRYCPSCGGDRWPEQYAKDRRKILLFETSMFIAAMVVLAVWIATRI